jgi:hypothetical protein
MKPPTATATTAVSRMNVSLHRPPVEDGPRAHDPHEGRGQPGDNGDDAKDSQRDGSARSRRHHDERESETNAQGGNHVEPDGVTAGWLNVTRRSGARIPTSPTRPIRMPTLNPSDFMSAWSAAR